MTDAAISPPSGAAAAGLAGVNWGGIARAPLRGDVALALGVIGIVLMLILPMPKWLLDFCLAVSISFSVLVLMTALFIQKPLEFSAFPSVLLIATLLRMGLSIASTRLILSNGQEGPDAAGRIIEAFGAFVMNGSYVIGAIVFIILTIVNFIVITKGSGRIAEVAARFSLDAMPGKQMAIDADLSSGLINEDEARERRKNLEAESNFFGSMDGASKFVRGDAIATLLITIINIVGGIVIGTLQHGMPIGEAGRVYTVLTIGDGLVSQIPALIISVGAGLLVSKAGVEGAADKAMTAQFSHYPQGLAMVSGLAFAAGLLPGMPLAPFALLGAISGTTAYLLHKQARAKKAKEAAAAEIAARTEPVEPPISESLAIDELKIELGYGLLPLINEVEGRRLTDQLKALRRSVAQEMGFVMPQVRILDNMALAQDSYVIRVKEMEAGQGRLKMGHLLAMDPTGGASALPGDHVKEPAFGLPATWVEEAMREEATFRGMTVVDPATVLATHFTEILREAMPDLLTYGATEKLLAELPKEHQKLVEDICPAQISRSGVQRVLQTLLSERVSIRDLPAILEGIAEASGHTQNLTAIVEHVRGRLSRQLCHANRAADGALPVVTLSPEWETAFTEALVGQGEERQLALAPSRLHDFVARVRTAFDEAANAGAAPVLLTSPVIRPYVRSLVERFRSQTTVMSQNEIHPKARLRTMGQV